MRRMTGRRCQWTEAVRKTIDEMIVWKSQGSYGVGAKDLP